MYRWHLGTLHKKLTTCVALLRQLAGSGWGAGATTLRNSHPSPGPFNCRVLCSCLLAQSSYTPYQSHHQCADCDWMHASFTSGQPFCPRRHPTCWASLQWSHTLAHRAVEPAHLLHSALTYPSSANAWHLKSRHQFVPDAKQLISLSHNNNIHAVHWEDHQWNVEWADSPTRLYIFIHDTGKYSPGVTLPRRAWVQLNHHRTSVGRFGSCLYKWGMASSPACECGTEEPTIDHVALQCPLHRFPHEDFLRLRLMVIVGLGGPMWCWWMFA